jgi:superfamily I DNA and RNA helicase
LDNSVTLSSIYRAKGNEKNLVYVAGLDEISRNEFDLKKKIFARNNLFVAMTRSKFCLRMSGCGLKNAFFQEIDDVLLDIFTRRGLRFKYKKIPPRCLDIINETEDAVTYQGTLPIL